MLKNSLFQPSLSFCFNTFFLFLLQRLSSFCFSGCPLFASSVPPCFFFLPYVFKVQPFTCCSLTQPKKPKRFSVFQPKRFSASVQPLFLLLFSALFFSVAAQKYYIQPKTFFFLQPKILFQFSPKISVQLQRLLLFCFFSSCLSFLPLATLYCPFSAQVFSSKPFSAASCLFI